DKLTAPMMFHLYRLKLCWLLSIMAGLKEVLDPIDGGKEFVRGDQYSDSISIARSKKSSLRSLGLPKSSFSTS
ncbi:3'(2') 5'-bisphosphate nucleotidase, partial [Bienertia sinuspersici]